MRPFLHTIPYDGGESTSISPAATVPRRSIANRHVKRRLHMYANRKLRSSKLFERLGPSYTPYHMMAESRPLYLLFRLVRTPLRLQRRYHAYHIHCQQARQSSCTYPSFVRRLGLFRKSDAKKCKMFDRSFCFSTSIVLVF